MGEYYGILETVGRVFWRRDVQDMVYIYIHDYIYIHNYIFIYIDMIIYTYIKLWVLANFKVSVSRSKQRPFSVEETNNMAQKVTKCDQLGATLEEEF